jgi:CSLREA domain-containing protein
MARHGGCRQLLASAGTGVYTQPPEVASMAARSESNPKLAFVLALLAATLPAAVCHAATFTVTTTGDTADSNTADGVCVATGGGCTLRAAIQQANSSVGADTIAFAIGTGAQSITPAAALPAISDPVTIDGTTQPGVAPPGISLVGSSAGAGVSGLVLSTSGNTIRGLTVRNFGAHGIAVNSSGNTIARNFIGTNNTGTTDQGNGAYGIAIFGSNNLIGGPAAAYQDKNLISGNNGGGLTIGSGTGNVVQNNFIGTNAGGSAALGNTGSGIFLSAVSGNVVRSGILSGNSGDGLRIVGGGSNTANENLLIGLDNGGTAKIPNGGNGVYLQGTTANSIGNSLLISGNLGSGVLITGAGTTGNQVFGNFIGIGFSGGNQAALGNSGTGVTITAGATGNTIGGTGNGLGNVISGNGLGGVVINSASHGNDVLSNVIGAGQGPGGTAVAFPNGGHGVQIASSNNSRIGVDASTGSANTISGNQGNGVDCASSTGTLIAGNSIGSGEGGVVALPNTGHGIRLVDCSNTTIGGDAPGTDNEVAGNALNGIYITGGSGIQIRANAIGIDGNGVVAVPNGQNGIFLENVTGTLITLLNTSGNTLNGLRIVGGSGTVFRRNFVGLNLAGTQAIPNGVHGVLLENTTGNQIGEADANGGNVICGSGGSGVYLVNASNNTIVNNQIGRLGGGTALPNNHYGVFVQGSSDNLIGGAAQNLIANNGLGGVAILSGERNRVRPNAVHSNGGIGIDLDRDGAMPLDGVTFPDSNDADGGANGLTNAPILTAATTTGVSGRLETLPNASITVDVYSTATCDPAGFGEATTFLGSTTVSTDANGFAGWSVAFAAVPSTVAFTATATDPTPATSELAQCITVNRRPVETLTVFNTSTDTVGEISTLHDPLAAAPGSVTTFTETIPFHGKWVMGDWNGDGIDTPAVYMTNGAFRFTNDVHAATGWSAIWFGFVGYPPVAGRFSAASNDCLGVVHNAVSGGNTYHNLYYTCNLTSGTTPVLQGQWLGSPLPSSLGFVGSEQFMAGDFDNNGLDSIALRRGEHISWTNVTPGSGHGAFNLAQYFGTPPGASGEGQAVAGDWDGDRFSSFGVYYQNGTFIRRNDLAWASGVYILQSVGQPVGTPTVADSWRPGGSAP